MNKCFACDRQLNKTIYLVVTEDGQTVYVGPDCYRKIRQSNKSYQPPLGGPKLQLIAEGGSNDAT